jgi:dipeptidyl aminopeptidase/acylaminoacyl peptidase
VDVEDCVHAARAASARGLADARRIVMRGGSAAGFTTLCALAFHGGFAAGAVYYGVADAESLARDTHKFEGRYLDTLIGPWPERADLFRERSPVHAADRIACPIIFFQGLDDRVVPPSQSEAMVASLRARGIEAEYHAFEGEGHGFRRADTLATCLEEELAFYRRILGLA